MNPSISPPAYSLHHLALTPLLGEEPIILAVLEKLTSMKPEDLEHFFGFLVSHGLAAQWYLGLKEQLEAVEVLARMVPRLKEQTFVMSQHYLLQKKKMREIDKILSDADIPYLIEKGAHARELLYPNPYTRPCADIDILISKEHKLRTISLLYRQGFTAKPKRATISNDLDLRSEGVHIDLHWDVLRPGRARSGLAEELIGSRQRYGDHFGPSNVHTMFLMLVHPVFKKYVTTHLALLVRFLDIIKWQERHDIDWDQLLEMADKYGLKTAVWLTGSYLKMLTGVDIGPGFLLEIRPGILKKTYLHLWLSKNLSEKMFKVPGAVKGLFTLAAHDTLADVLRFLVTKRKLDAAVANELQEIKYLIEKEELP